MIRRWTFAEISTLLSLALLWGLASTSLAVAGPQAPAQPSATTQASSSGEPGESPSAARAEGGQPVDYAAKEAAWQRHLGLEAASPFAGLQWRSIGPVVMGGRVVDIENVPGMPYSFYAAYASGGLWRTDNNGVTFEPLSDQMPTMIMGDIAVDPNHPDRVWVGTGENNSSRSSYGGLGVYRSDDGGTTWTHKGLGNSDRIGRIVVDPRDGDRLFVGVLGRLYAPGGERGLYRSTDGGDSWQRVLSTGEDDGWTGIIDLVMDPGNPDVLYASAWHRQRRPWEFVEGGEGSAIYRSSDGGDTWTRLEGGLPSGGDVGRIGLAISASNPDILYAAVDNQEPLPEEEWDLGGQSLSIKRLRKMSEGELLAHDAQDIEAFIQGNDLDTELDATELIRLIEAGELTVQDLLDEVSDANADLFQTDIKGLEVYRSDDGGESWRRTHDDPIRNVVYTYGYYFGQIRVSPTDPDEVYAMGVPFIKSTDGGKTWEGRNGRGVHVDYQSQWIDLEDSSRTWVGNDGGIDASYDGGKTWVKIDRQAVGQFYAIAVDDEDPYNVYGGLQDNGSWAGSSRSRPALDAWRGIGGGDGMHVEVDPRDGVLYTGFQFGFYFRSDGQVVRPRDKLKEPALRYNWQTPIRLSSHNADILYYGAQRLFRSMDRGETWTAISDDLTRSEERGNVPFATISTLSESPLHFGLLWVGTDDGQVWVTGDGGSTWRDAGGGLVKERWISRVVASSHEKERAFATANGYRQDDPEPYVYRTDDLGRSWTPISDGLPAEPVNVIREDPVNANVLYVGTDRGVYVSLDLGQSWTGLSGSAEGALPNVPVHDLVVHPRQRELVAGTHGRSVWVVDVLPVQELENVREEDVHVFPLETVQAQRGWRSRPNIWFADLYDAPELEIPFWVKEAAPAVLTVLDGDGRELRRWEMQASAGINVSTWDLLLDEELAPKAEKARLAEESQAEAKGKKGKKKKGKKAEEEAPEPERGTLAKTPWAEALRLEWPLYVTPGTYTLKITAGEASSETEIEIEAPQALEPRAAKKQRIRGQEGGLER